jgi:P4 family phage/plasmid primase-like protien
MSLTDHLLGGLGDPDDWTPGDEAHIACSVADALRRDGMDEGRIYRHLGVLNMMMATNTALHPLTDSQRRTISIAASTMSPTKLLRDQDIRPYPPSLTPDVPNWLPDDSAKVLADTVIKDLASPPDVREAHAGLLVWADTHWRKVEAPEIAARASSFSGWPIRAAGVGGLGQPKSKPRKINGVKDVLDRAVNSVHVRGFDLDQDRVPGCSFNNCFIQVDVDTGALTPQPHCREQYATEVFPFDHVPNATPTRFINMLRSCWADFPPSDQDAMVEVVRNFIGLALAGITWKYRGTGLLLVGDGMNGKSTIQGVIEALFLRENVTSLQPGDLAATASMRTSLSRSRLNSVAELSAASWTRTDVIKAILTGDPITANPKFLSEFSFAPRSAQVYGCNALPKISDDSAGFWSRFTVLPFRMTFDRNNPVTNTNLRSEVLVELPEIASWALESLVDVALNRGIPQPGPSMEAKELWRQESNSVLAFLEHIVHEKGAGWEAPTKVVHQEYQMFVADNQMDPVGRNKFFKALEQKGASRKGRVFRFPDLSIAS